MISCSYSGDSTSWKPRRSRIPGNFREPRQSHQSFKLKWLQAGQPRDRVCSCTPRSRNLGSVEFVGFGQVLFCLTCTVVACPWLGAYCLNWVLWSFLVQMISIVVLFMAKHILCISAFSWGPCKLGSFHSTYTILLTLMLWNLMDLSECSKKTGNTDWSNSFLAYSPKLARAKTIMLLWKTCMAQAQALVRQVVTSPLLFQSTFW